MESEKIQREKNHTCNSNKKDNKNKLNKKMDKIYMMRILKS